MPNNVRLLTPNMRKDTLTIRVTPTLDTNIYASGDVLFDATAVANAMFTLGGTGEIESIVVLDKDDQGIAMDLVILNAATSIGAFNLAPDPTDTEAGTILGTINLAAANYIDFGDSKLATFKQLEFPVKAAAATKGLWIAAITRGTPTHTAAGLVFDITIRRD